MVGCRLSEISFWNSEANCIVFPFLIKSRGFGKSDDFPILVDFALAKTSPYDNYSSFDLTKGTFGGQRSVGG